MSTKDLWDALGLGFELWLFYVISTGIFNLSLESDHFFQNMGALIILSACLAVFCMTEYKRLFKKKTSAALPPKPMKTISEAKRTVDRTVPKAFKKEMRTLQAQMDRMKRKREMLDRELKNVFGDSRISYEKFARTIDGVESVFIDNVSKIVTRINIFDEDGYEKVFRDHQEYTDAIEPYNAHFKYVKERLEENEQILTKTDRLLLEVTNLTDRSSSVDNLPAMVELNELIDQTKLYRQNGH